MKVLVTFERALNEHVAMQGKIRWGRTLRTAKYKVEQMCLCLEAVQDERDEVGRCACPLLLRAHCFIRKEKSMPFGVDQGKLMIVPIFPLA